MEKDNSGRANAAGKSNSVPHKSLLGGRSALSPSHSLAACTCVLPGRSLPRPDPTGGGGGGGGGGETGAKRRQVMTYSILT